MILTIATIVLLTAALRIVPMKLLPHGGGVDQWYWRSYIEALHKDKAFPPALPQFKLEIAQWYPPLFPVLMARLPSAMFERYAGYLAVVLDLLRLLLLLLATKALTNDITAVAVSGIIYCLIPILTTYNLQLNPRGLGALFLDLLWLGTAVAIINDENLWWLFSVPGGLMMLTHKMTTQVFLFTAITASIALQDIRPVLLIPLSVLAAMLISKGFYWKVLRHHADISAFWFRNWKWMGSNPVLESPVYGVRGFESQSKYYRSGIRAAFKRFTFVIGFNPWMPSVLLIGLIAFTVRYEMNTFQHLTFGWLLATFVFSLITTIIPMLRFLGQGYLYGYNGAFPAALMVGLSWDFVSQNPLAIGVLCITVIASCFSLYTFFRTLQNSRTLKVDNDLNNAIARLKQLPDGIVMCLPQHWHEVVAYKTKKAVAFGGHGYGFKLLESVFPRILYPIKDLIAKHEIKYLLIWTSYVNKAFLDDLPESDNEQFGEYVLYKLK